ncbi:MAG: hypothetical protein RR595_01180 [Lysinibacillus sp.]
MFYNYKFWHSLANPTYFTQMVEQAEIRGYKKRSFTVFMFAIILFMAREFWGIGTESLTTLFATNQGDAYFVARTLSMIGAMLWAILYFAFHYYGIPYILYLLTDIPYKWIQKVQLYVITFLLLEKAILFVVFYTVGYTTSFSFFSLAPIAQQVIDTDYVLLAINQFTISTVVAIIIQFSFLSKWEDNMNKKALLVKIILLYVIMAVFIGMYSVLPIQEWISRGLG